MKVLGLLAFATVFLLSSAYADSRGRGRHSSLLEPEDRRHWEALQRRKPPPGKIPGPQEEFQGDPNLRQLSEDEESKNVYLASDMHKKHSHLDSHNNMKRRHVVNGDYSVDNVEESQQERSRSLRSERNSP